MPERLPETLQQKLSDRLRYYDDIGIGRFYRDRGATLPPDVQVSAAAIGIEFSSHIAIGLLHILHQLGAPHSVDEHIDGTPITIRQTHLLGHPVSRLFALVGTVAAAVAGPLESGVGFAQQCVVIRECHEVIAHIAGGGIESRRVPGTTRVLAAHIIDRA